jgi:hypothetical protein
MGKMENKLPGLLIKALMVFLLVATVITCNPRRMSNREKAEGLLSNYTSTVQEYVEASSQSLNLIRQAIALLDKPIVSEMDRKNAKALEDQADKMSQKAQQLKLALSRDLLEEAKKRHIPQAYVELVFKEYVERSASLN